MAVKEVTEINECSDRNVEENVPALFGNYDSNDNNNNNNDSKNIIVIIIMILIIIIIIIIINIIINKIIMIFTFFHSHPFMWLANHF